MVPTMIETTARVAAAIEQTGGQYVIVGSLASAAHGRARATMDADIVASLDPGAAESIVRALEGEFYADASSIREAVRSGAHFNIIHMSTGFKVDVYAVGSEPFNRMNLARCARAVLQADPRIELNVATAEDVVLSKLKWYRDGGEVSDRQWFDITGVLAMKRGALDLEYMQKWAKHLGVEALLQRALSEV